MKLLILILVGYLGYRAFKSWMVSNTSSGRSVAGKDAGAIDDIMVKDPFCEVYFPKRNGVHLRHAGEDLYFCSTESRDKFLAERSASKT
jgi:YHS domain-containing protein